MFFLNPWLWLGALAIAAPLWLHLRRKQESNLVRFSTLRFLEDNPQPRQSPLRLRDLPLFVVRTLALLLLVAAFTWPYLKGAKTAPIKESRVYILDNTLSHQANGGFERDRNHVLEALSQAGLDIQIGVVELAASPRVLVAFGDSRETAGRKIKELQASFDRGSYLAAFRQANSLLANSLGDQKRIVLLGDNQENQWSENVNTPPFLHNVRIDLPGSTTPSLPNLSLSEPRAQRIFMGDRSLVNFSVKLNHTGGAKNANLQLRGNGQSVFNRTISLEEQPATILVQAQWEAEPGAWLRGEVTVEGTPDALPADDHVFFALAPVVEGKVTLLAQSPFLRLALSPDIMRGQWATRVLEPARLTAELNADQDADVLCIESSYLQSSEARKLVSRYLSNGRGVVLLVNRVTPLIAGCLRELGFEPEGIVTPGDGPEKFQFIVSNHPIFHPFSSPEYGNLMDIKVNQYYRLRSSQSMPLIYSARGDGLFFQGTRLQGKLFVMPFGLDREYTSWPVHQSFIPFLDLTLQTARAEDPTPTNFEPGEMGAVQMPAGSTTRELVLRDGEQIRARATVEEGKAQMRLPDRPGLYNITYDDSARVQKVFSVNPSPKESELVFIDSPEAMKVWRVNQPEKTGQPAHSVASAKINLAAILQQRFWWWMVLGGLLALMLEILLAERKRRQEATD